MTKLILAVMALLLTACAGSPYTGRRSDPEPVAVNGSLCEGKGPSCDPVEILHTR